ncbi:hypothetical protein M0534_08380 [Methylonatrum kenyense]|uniref:hypothetical protein n=1 Tax=Methylonatrum kenyense TaxID=455253 RepID=UPI0020BEE284|nr:hypothetical protein [Methylonatrum kenyense]MCK8516340.1 hypothetical protein [Methylonatrum kenyense]
MKCPSVVVFLICATLLSGCGFVGDPDQRVLFPSQPHDTEYQYANLARQIASEKPCYLISPDSISVAPFNASGTRAIQLRSRCFATVAERAARPELCEHVVSVSTLLYSGHANDRARCLREADHGQARSGVGVVEEGAMFELAGFSDADIDGLMQAHQLPADARYCLVFSPEFFDAIDHMPRFSSEDEVIGIEDVVWKPHPFLLLPGFPCTGKFVDADPS